jgi:anti-sigma regulatory factor (Ser/Thr protein kinase)
VVTSDHAVVYSLTRDPQSVRHARRIVSDSLVGGDRSHFLDTALLLVSELVGNAVRYGAEPITLDVVRADHELMIGVSDAAPQLPQMPPAPADLPVMSATSAVETANSQPVGGRGLQLIEALADRWGVQKREQDKRVWFVLRRSVQG